VAIGEGRPSSDDDGARQDQKQDEHDRREDGILGQHCHDDSAGLVLANDTSPSRAEDAPPESKQNGSV
jgi:hypothetical protein